MKISIAPILLSTWFTLLTYRFLDFARKRRKQIQILRCDLIGELPDCLLISILTRLPVKDTIQTSVLSKRWTTIYKFVVHLNLDFRCHHLFHRNHYLFDMVQAYLLVFCCCLIKSHMSFSDNGAAFWEFLKYLGNINTADVKKLVVRCCCSLPKPCFYYSFCAYSLCSCHYILYCMPGLRYLEVNSSKEFLPEFYTNNMSLRNLRLSKVTLVDGALDLILSACLGLCSLRMDYCKFSSPTLLIRGPNLRLEHLKIEECIRVKEIELCASNLVTFEFKSSRKIIELTFDHVPRLESMSYDGFQRDVMYQVCVRLPSVLPPNQLKSLTLASEYDINRASTFGLINTYSNLRQLRLQLSHTAYTNMLLGIIPLLQSCPLLLEFHLDTEFVQDDGPKAMRPQNAETHSQLKRVEITGFCGYRNEIEFALYILENAECLEQMQISRCPNWHFRFGRSVERKHKPRWSRHTREDIRQQLQGRALSETARVIIQHFPAYNDTWSRHETDYDSHCP
ncbi:FBD-associated F-box protein [Striga asiatica]|uniref:FBD-associated F-box protein n=1 Tax=Striga asiatica TaxID=4170 RepID=A0A5A7P465_STRAF|nr:FBD-associated F-box protein [Striga asiatica]